jgi:hypothetical protein
MDTLHNTSSSSFSLFLSQHSHPFLSTFRRYPHTHFSFLHLSTIRPIHKQNNDTITENQTIRHAHPDPTSWSLVGYTSASRIACRFLAVGGTSTKVPCNATAITAHPSQAFFRFQICAPPRSSRCDDDVMAPWSTSGIEIGSIKAEGKW